VTGRLGEDELWEGAAEWLAAAEDELRAGRLRVAFESARHAAELAGKARLLSATGTYPKSHTIASQLHRAGLVPSGVDAKAVHRLLSEFTLGTYGFDRPLAREDVVAAIALARSMLPPA